MKKLVSILLSLGAIGAISCAVGCGDKPADSSPAEPIKYSFKVFAKDGVQLSEENLKIVVYGKDGTSVASLSLDDSGERSKKLNPDVYTVCLENEAGEKIYTTTTQLTCDTPVSLYLLDQPTGGTGDEQDQYEIKNGYYNVPLSKFNATYYAFTPSKTGTYRITSIGSADVAYAEYDASEEYLNPAPIQSIDDNGSDVNFVYEFDVNPTEYNSMEDTGAYKVYFSVGFADKATDTSATSSIISVEYINSSYTEAGEPEFTYSTVTLTKEDADSVLFDSQGEIVPFTSQEGVLTPLAYNATIVYNETDRYYHVGSANGPLVVMPFTVTPERLLDKPFNKIANPDPNDPTDNANPATLHLTFTDEVNYTVTVKEYNTLINEIYPAAVNADGVYPLTEEMREFLYQFVVVAENDINVQNIPRELRWKAPLYYYETGTIAADRPDVSGWDGDKPTNGEGTKNAPYTIGLGDFCAPFGSVSGIVYYTYTSNKSGFLTINTKSDNAVVSFINETVTVNGDIVSSTSESGDIHGKGSYAFEVSNGSVLTIQICTNDWNSASIEFSLSYSTDKPLDSTPGGMGNPYSLQMGETKAVAEGVIAIWYAITPTETAEYTFSTNDKDADITVYEGKAFGAKVKSKSGAGSFTVTLEAGKTYFVGVGEGVNDYFTVYFTCEKA